MPTVFLPPALRKVADGQSRIDVPGGSLRAVVAELESRYPGIRSRLCEGDRLRPGLSVVIGSNVADASLLQPVPSNAEIHFLPSVGGG